AGVPHWYAVGARVGQVKIGGGQGGSEHKFPRPTRPICFGRTHRPPGHIILRIAKKLELFGITKDGPCETAGPGSEWRVTLLRIRATIAAVVEIEDAFVCSAAREIVAISARAIIDAKASGQFSVLNQATKKGNPLVAFAH